MRRLTAVRLLASALVAGCVVPAGGFDDDGSGVSVHPAPGEMIRQGDVVVIRNGSGARIECGNTYLVTSEMEIAYVPIGGQAEVTLDGPRDVDEIDGDLYRGWVGFYCWEEGREDLVREWQYGSPV